MTRSTSLSIILSMGLTTVISAIPPSGFTEILVMELAKVPFSISVTGKWTLLEKNEI